MNPGIRKFLKIPLIVLCLSLPCVPWLWSGINRFDRLDQSKAERQACVERICKLAEENQTLLNEVQLLRTDMKYLESVVRSKFHFIKENEVIYRFGKASDG